MGLVLNFAPNIDEDIAQCVFDSLGREPGIKSTLDTMHATEKTSIVREPCFRCLRVDDASVLGKSNSAQSLLSALSCFDQVSVGSTDMQS